MLDPGLRWRQAAPSCRAGPWRGDEPGPSLAAGRWASSGPRAQSWVWGSLRAAWGDPGLRVALCWVLGVSGDQPADLAGGC